MPTKRKSKSKPGNAPKLSPLLRSSLEVLEHGLHHYFRSNTSKDMKFALMHIDQSIELMLKERVRAGGESIYRPKNKKETISMWEAYDVLENKFKIQFPEKPDLEILHDERNKIQHGSSNPNSDDAAFHIDKAMQFIRKFSLSELSIDLFDYLDSEHLESFGIQSSPKTQTP